MFAEELNGNANRKRQEQARERRRKLKEQQLKKEQQQKNNTKSSRTYRDDDGLQQLVKNNTQRDTGSVADVVAKDSKDNHKLFAKSPNPADALSKALEQRQIRSLQKLHNASATVIQSTYRSWHYVSKLEQSEREILQSRLHDLSALRDILKKQQNEVYVPPTSLTIGFVNQMLFLSHTTPKYQRMTINGDSAGSLVDSIECFYFSRIKPPTSEDIKLIVKIIEIVLLPGLLGGDEHLDPTVVWLESKEGRFKLKKLLRLSCYILTMKLPCGEGNQFNSVLLAQDDEIGIIDKFIRVLIGIHSFKPKNENVVKFCRQVLLKQDYDFTGLKPGGIGIGMRPLMMENLDLIHLLRSFLLYPNKSETQVIATNMEESTLKKVSMGDQQRYDLIFGLVLTGVLQINCVKLTSRFLSEILTIPTLRWKVTAVTLNYLVQYDVTKNYVPLLHILKIFIGCFEAKILNGLLPDLLPTLDVPLTLCPAPTVLCLFCNMVQLGFICPFINGNKDHIDFDAAALYFNFMTVLIDLIPLGTFSSRQSSVEWLNDGTQSTPVILSPLIIDQCKLIFNDSYVRSLFNCAIDKDCMNVDTIINRKDKRDVTLEADLEEILTQSLTEVAAREAMVDRSKGFMQSNWAKKLSHKFKSVFTQESRIQKKDKKGGLMNTSEMSRNLATGTVKLSSESKETKSDVCKQEIFNSELFFALSRLYSVFLSRWGGGGDEDIVKRHHLESSVQSKKAIATSKPEQCFLSFLNVLCFSTSYLKTAWALIQSNQSIANQLHELTDVNKRARPIRSLRVDPKLISRNHPKNTAQSILLMFVISLSHILIVTDDIELHNMGSPLPLHQIRRCILLLKTLLYRACCLDDTKAFDSGSFVNNHFGLSLITSSSKLMRDLHDRSSRRALCAPKLWLFGDLLEGDIKRSKSYDDLCVVLESPVLRVCPFLVSFKRRLKLFEKIVTTNRESIQGRNDGFSPRPGVKVSIMRGRVLEDGLLHLNKLGRSLRQRIIVRYLNQAGTEEIGLDAGGLFKEFWSDLSALSFNLDYGLFSETENGYMYPNPSARAAHGSDSIILFEFLGRILGKALYEGITIKPQFAHFFLSFLRGEYNFLHMLPDLATMDQTLYNNLMFLKTYDGDAEDLALTFTVANDDFGTNKEIELIPNGSQVDVTNANKHRYIGLVAKHHVCDRVKEQSQAFTRGLWDVIDRNWLSIFNEPELQVLISGASDGKIDVEDMKSHSKYTGGYTIFDRNIHRFWNIVSSLSRKHQSDLLRFVTSCERPPPLGFGSLNPPFTIQRVSIMVDSDKLPSASTCFNILKLPTYSSEKVMKERLIYAIESGAGFELT